VVIDCDVFASLNIKTYNHESMENSFDRANELLNLQQPLKVDDKQNLSANTLVIGTIDSISQSSGLGLNHTVQSAIDKWTGKQAVDLFNTFAKIRG
jgi:UTP-glucose-1-phosphate uridylyltransferase